ncbi:MAG: hypothetical protein ABSG64_00330 [Solirubrobacteraceae bacterium]
MNILLDADELRGVAHLFLQLCGDMESSAGHIDLAGLVGAPPDVTANVTEQVGQVAVQLISAGENLQEQSAMLSSRATLTDAADANWGSPASSTLNFLRSPTSSFGDFFLPPNESVSPSGAPQASALVLSGSTKLGHDVYLDYSLQDGDVTSSESHLKVGPDGVSFGASYDHSDGVTASVDLQVGTKSEKLTVAASAFVGTEDSANVEAGVGPDGAYLDAGASDFTGFTLDVAASGTIDGVTPSAELGLSYGVGASADIKAELTDHDVGVQINFSVAEGVGVSGEFGLSVNPEALANGMKHLGTTVVDQDCQQYSLGLC